MGLRLSRGLFGEFRGDELIHLAGVGLAAGGLHDLANDGAGHLGVAGPVFGHNVGVGGNSLIDGGFDGPVVADDLQPAGGNNLVDVPNVLGKSADDAESELKSAGFSVKKRKFFGALYDTVNLQSPRSGKKAPRGSTVTIAVL